MYYEEDRVPFEESDEESKGKKPSTDKEETEAVV
ncbi:hypothetical protein FHS14_003820 [Paenibacillus baekrokdamisoli]|nr:hypothetical protein [Paenibacillus baekrokdamisoli]